MNLLPHAGLLVALAAGSAIAAPIDLTIDPSQSTLDMTMNVDVTIANSTDSDSSTLSGTMSIELDDAGNPSLISIHDLMVVIDDTMNFDWSFGFFGSADAVLDNGSVSYANPGVTTGPVPVVSGAFAFPEVLVNLGGQLDVSYDIFLVGSGSEMTNLGDQGSFASAYSGTVVVVGETITVSTTLPLDAVVPLVDSTGTELGTLTVTGSAMIVATGTIPSCSADLNNDGLLNFFDVSAFLGAFTTMDPSADFTGDGLFNFFDVSAFLGAFSAGCP